jgi:hypothetical protein
MGLHNGVPYNVQRNMPLGKFQFSSERLESVRKDAECTFEYDDEDDDVSADFPKYSMVQRIKDLRSDPAGRSYVESG